MSGTPRRIAPLTRPVPVMILKLLFSPLSPANLLPLVAAPWSQDDTQEQQLRLGASAALVGAGGTGDALDTPLEEAPLG